MAVVLQPQLQAIFPALFPQAADVLGRHAVGHEPAQVPQESLRLVGAADNPPRQYRQPRARFVVVGLSEHFGKIIRPVLRSHLVAVSHNVLERPALRRLHPLEQLADVRVEMRARRRAVHLVHFEAHALVRSGGVLHARRRHAGAEDDPVAAGHVPTQRAIAGKIPGEIAHAAGGHGKRRGVRLGRGRPEIGVPHRQRRRVHLGKLFLDV